MEKGTYILVLNLKDSCEVNVGSLGNISLERGFYTYIGSAFGPGGFKRINRHRKVVNGDNNKRHWHIDYLNGNNHSELTTVYRIPGEKIECSLAQKLSGKSIGKFGCSDCKCGSHLMFYEDLGSLENDVEKVLESISAKYFRAE